MMNFEKSTAKLSWASEFRLRQVQEWNCVPNRNGAVFYTAGRSAREPAVAKWRSGDTHAGVSCRWPKTLNEKEAAKQLAQERKRQQEENRKKEQI
uniref:Uncharacterized protein n=1 Tax=Trichogramma kaykai TaxID=54128 RepID=A0ABD2XPK8_9HYME